MFQNMQHVGIKEEGKISTTDKLEGMEQKYYSMVEEFSLVTLRNNTRNHTVKDDLQLHKNMTF